MQLFHIHCSGPEREKSHRPLHSLWRHASDPKRRRWQIVLVRPAGCAKKKVISAPSFSATAARRSEVFAPKPSANSVPTSGGNVNTEKLSTGRSIDEMAGEDADTWRGVDTGRVTQENGLFRRDAGRPTHIKRACGIASQTLPFMYDAILRRRLTSRRRCRSDRPCCRCSGPDSRR